MRILRYIYPANGRVIAEEINVSQIIRPPVTHETGTSRIEIYNNHGDLICIMNNRRKLGMLKLQRGFYLLRELDQKGRVIKSDKLVF